MGICTEVFILSLKMQFITFLLPSIVYLLKRISRIIFLVGTFVSRRKYRTSHYFFLKFYKLSVKLVVYIILIFISHQYYSYLWSILNSSLFFLKILKIKIILHQNIFLSNEIIFLYINLFGTINIILIFGLF